MIWVMENNFLWRVAKYIFFIEKRKLKTDPQIKVGLGLDLWLRIVERYILGRTFYLVRMVLP